MTLQVTVELLGVKDNGMGEPFGPLMVYTPPEPPGPAAGAAVGTRVIPAEFKE
jgi:hypothetical protein